MPRIGRAISIVAGLVAATAGTFLLMGSLRTGPAQAVRMEQARIEAIGRLWEGRLEAARGTFRDQLVQTGVIPALSYPDEWSDWRVRNKLQTVFSAWPKEYGSLKGLGLLTSAGAIHTAMGDTSGLGEALKSIDRQENTELAVMGRATGHAELIAIQYKPADLEKGIPSGRIVGLVSAGNLLVADMDPGQAWTLLAAPDQPLLSTGSPAEAQVSSTMWSLLVSEGTGTVKHGNGSLCFTRVRIPGMTPLLLMHSVRVSSAAGFVALAIILLGAGLLAFVAISTRRSELPAAPQETKRSAEPSLLSESGNFRQIFQAIDDPLLVLDQTGLVVRANRTAQDWLKLQKGKPADDLTIRTGSDELAATEFFSRIAEDSTAYSGACRLNTDSVSVSYILKANRLSRDEDGKGSVLLHFHIQPVLTDERAYMPPVFVQAAASETTPEPDCPYPVIAVTEDGLITGYNESAREACPRIENTPLLSDVLPALSNRDWPELLSADPGSTFESLFGASACEFTLVHSNGRILLYGHRLADSKRLEIEMKQAQENFFALCSLSPVPILLVDPRDHAITEANSAAADLFGVTPAELHGQFFGSLSADPWELVGGEDIFTAASAHGRTTRCWQRYELIKIEGSPMLLMILEPIPEIFTTPADPDPAALTAASVPAADVNALPPMPLGPALLITLNPTVREVARRLLEKVGHPCEVFSSLDDATVWLITHDQRPELTAIDLSDFDDAESWIEEMRSRCGDVPCVAFTDSEGYSLPNGGLNEFLAKPFDLNSLTDALKALHLEAELCEIYDSGYEADNPEA